MSIPLRAYRDVPAEPLAGKPVMDTNNYYAQRDGRFPSLDDGTSTSAELLQEHLAGAGDDVAAEKAVTEFLDAIGYDTVDAGPLGAGSRRFQVEALLLGRQAQAYELLLRPGRASAEDPQLLDRRTGLGRARAVAHRGQASRIVEWPAMP